MNLYKHIEEWEIKLNSRDYWALLFIGCLSLFLSYLWISLPFYLGFKLNKKTHASVHNAGNSSLPEVLVLIQRNHLQSLSVAIESNPHLLYSEYKNQTLLMWCKHYNNSKAQALIIQLLRKYPKTQPLSA